ncbi:MAG: hypothetical protein N2D54_04420, partial [Chloroflexota bacterium]
AFIMETEKNAIIALPGVPREMEHLMTNKVIPYLRKRFALSGVIKARVIHTAGFGESQIDEIIEDLEQGSNPTVGLAAHAGAVDVRITAKASSEAEALALIAPVEAEVNKRLSEWIVGTAQETLEGAALANIGDKNWKLVVVESGLGGGLTQRLVNAEGPFLGGDVLPEMPNMEELHNICQDYLESRGAEACLGVSLKHGEEKQNLNLVLLSPIKERTLSRSYGGPPQMATQWAVNLCLDFIRRLKTE